MYNLAADAIQAGTPISRAFGNSDMYKDDDNESNAFLVEELFSKLESQAAKILTTLDKLITGPAASRSFPLTRKEVNILRKFLFLLQYRRESHAVQYLEDRFDPQTQNEVDTFKRKFDLKDSYAAFLFNLRSFLELDHWEIPNSERILKSDRSLYETELASMHLAFFVAPDDAEFIVTDNGFGLWEGTYLPSLTLLIQSMAGGNPMGSSFKHTITYPVSPRLLVMLRNNVVWAIEAGGQPSLLGDKIPDNSLFKDFPRTKASVRYHPPPTEPLEDIIADHEKLCRRVHDILTFRLHMLTAEQTWRVNSLRLENISQWITFKSPRKLIDTLQYFETNSGTQGAANWTPPKAGQDMMYSKRSYASLIRQVEYLLESGVPPPPVPTPVPRPQPTTVTSSPAPSTAARPSAPRSSTTPMTAAEEEARAAADPSFNELLRARVEGGPMLPTSHKKKLEEWTKFDEQEPEVKPRKPLLRRKLYTAPEYAALGTQFLLRQLVAELFPR